MDTPCRDMWSSMSSNKFLSICIRDVRVFFSTSGLTLRPSSEPLFRVQMGASCVRTYLPTYLPTYLHTYIHAYMHTCIHAYMHTCIHSYVHTCIHAYMHTCIHAYLRTYVPTYVRTHIRTHIRTYMHARLHTCIHAYMHTYYGVGDCTIMGKGYILNFIRLQYASLYSEGSST